MSCNIGNRLNIKLHFKNYNQALKGDLEKIVGEEVTVRPGKLVVNGNCVLRVKKWLLGLGF